MIPNLLKKIAKLLESIEPKVFIDL